MLQGSAFGAPKLNKRIRQPKICSVLAGRSSSSQESATPKTLDMEMGRRRGAARQQIAYRQKFEQQVALLAGADTSMKNGKVLITRWELADSRQLNPQCVQSQLLAPLCLKSLLRLLTSYRGCSRLLSTSSLGSASAPSLRSAATAGCSGA